MALRRLLLAISLLLLPGCCQAIVSDPGDRSLGKLPARLVDPDPSRPVDATPATPATTAAAGGEGIQTAALLGPPRAEEPSGAGLPSAKPARLPLVMPKDLPGTEAPPLEWPRGKEARERTLKELYPELPALPPEVRPAPGPDGRPLTLADLQRLAADNSPNIRNALAAVDAARGAVIQAGAYPNPTVAWEADTVGTTGAGYQGAYIDQLVKGGNDLRLKKAMAIMDLRNANLALRKAQADLATQVRTGYFSVLVAQEGIRVNRALVRFTDSVYRVQVDLLAAGAAAPYEPMQMRPLALQARLTLVQAENQYQASWRQLAAALGLPGMPPTEVAGRVDMPVPVYDQDEVLKLVLNNHTDVLTALSNLEKGRYNVTLNRVAPFPDFDVRALIQKDYTTPPFFMVYSAVVAMQVPVWDQNKGGVLQAKAQLVQAGQAVQQAKLQLTGTLADAYNRYVTARQQVQISMQQIRDQVRVYRGVYERHGQDPDAVGFGDVVTAQQTLATYISTYITSLGLQWTAVVDVANLLQTDDLFQTGKTQQVVPVPDLEELLPAPCNLYMNKGRPAFRAQAAGPDQGAGSRQAAADQPALSFSEAPPALSAGTGPARDPGGDRTAGP